MDFQLPSEFDAALVNRKTYGKPKKNRLRVHMADQVVPIVALRENGFTVDAEAPRLRGAVELYDGARHLAECLVVISQKDAHSVTYEYKRRTNVTLTAPLDYERDEFAPIALIERA